jgi:primary-amine oxidase
MHPDAVPFRRAPVIGHTVWVTKHHDAERWPCGAYPTQSSEDTGLTRWISDHEPLEVTDVVEWHVFGIHHVTRVEDWPVMPADTVSFWLKPWGFFDQNPSIDVAPSVKEEGGHCHSGTGIDETMDPQHLR